MDDMPRPRLPHIQREKTRHGRFVWYFRRRGEGRVRLPDEYGSDEFMAAYRAALLGEAASKPLKPNPNTLRWVVDLYRKSAAFQALKPRTKRVREGILRSICEAAGDADITDVDRPALVEMRDRRADRPEAANAYLKVMRAVLDCAMEANLIQSNPAREVKSLAGSREGFHTWTVDEVERFEARHPVGTKARLALDIMLYTGLRRQDVVVIGRQHIRAGEISIRPQKTAETTGVSVTVPILPPLAASIDAAPTGELHLLVTEFGKPFTSNGFGNWFRKRCEEAGVPGSAHGLRKASAVRAAEAGATTNELMAMFGWSTAKEAQRYTQAAERKKLARAGSLKLSRTTQKVRDKTKKVD